MSAALVFLMQPGFMCLESGLTRSKNSINVAVKNLVDFVISVAAFWGVGYGIMFGLSPDGVVGTNGFFPSFESDAWGASLFFFQAMFCGTATTIFSGAVAERMRFSSYVAAAAFTSVLIYPLFGHWAWGGLASPDSAGLLEKMGFVDFAGSTVVHSVGGWVALAALLVIGPRLGRFSDSGEPRELNASNLPLSVLGTLLLWFGWFGFNGGSTLAMDASVPGIIVNTTLAGAAGALACMLAGRSLDGISKASHLINGSLGGLVAITANCHCVSVWSAVVIGLAAGPIVILVERLLLRLKIDDAVGAVPVHLGCGVWGTLAVALFGDPERIGTGLSAVGQFGVQALGVFAAFVVAFLLPYLALRGLDRISPLRVAPEDEDVGLNVSEHGAKTELADLFRAMDRQAETKDLSLRVPEEPFTEVGHIARRYNQVMDALQAALAKTEAIVSTATDAIMTFAADTLVVMSANPAAPRMFGIEAAALEGVHVSDLFRGEGAALHAFFSGEHVEMEARRGDGSVFPVEAVVTGADAAGASFLVGTFRDISERKQAEEALRRSKNRYRSFFENTGTAIFVDEPDGLITHVNGRFAAMVGRAGDEIEGRMKFTDFLSPEDARIVRRRHLRRLKDPESAPKNYEVSLVDSHGVSIPALMTVSVIPGGRATLNSLLDLSALERARNALNRQQEYFRQLFDNSPQAITLVDPDGRILDVNAGFEAMFGYGVDEVKGLYNRNLIVPEDRRDEVDAFRKSILTGSPVRRETVRRRKDQRLIPVSLVGYPIMVEGEMSGVYYIYTDISERKAFESQLSHQAFHDPLTGLPNRALLLERLGRAVSRAERRRDYAYAVILLDLDGFKKINDSLGHIYGDKFLMKTAHRLRRVLREVDTVARLGGDEFAVLLEEFSARREVVTVLKRMLRIVAKPYVLDGVEVSSTASMGVVLRTENYKSPLELLRDADTAMYRAKEQGKNRFKAFNSRMHEQALDALKIESELREAVEEDQLVLEYQPICRVKDGAVSGFEALVRWEHPDRGRIQPGAFIPLAEETGLILPLGRWVLRQACLQARRWLDSPDMAAGHAGLSVSVNVSSMQLHKDDLAEYAAQCLDEAGLEGERLRLEFTEGVLMENATRTVDKLNRLKELGVKLVIDDFGTGYSSLSYLQKFPIDSLKIDRSFISGPGDEKEQAEIVKAIISLAGNLDLSVVAEGVERADQLERLKDAGCREVQGFYLSRPVAADAAGELLRDGAFRLR